MKQQIIDVLTRVHNMGGFEEENLINIAIYTDNELAEIEGVSVSESKEVWGNYDYALMFSDHPDYCFIRKHGDIDYEIMIWLCEINLLELRKIENYFEILDMFGGEPSDDYKTDLYAALEDNKYFSYVSYQNAMQMLEQP